MSASDTMSANDAKSAKKEKSLSPVLDAILRGGASVSLNLMLMSRDFPKEAHLFKTAAMRGAVIFKFPNFAEDVSKELAKAFGGPSSVEYHPVETGIYFPYSDETPQDGGCAIYLRQRNYHDLLVEYLGAPGENPDGTDNPVSSDIKLLSLMDTVPTLDPFLLKESLDVNHFQYDPSVLRLGATEDIDIRKLISDKIAPIVQKAFEAGDRSMANRDRLLASLWDPTMPEATNFVRAFGISEKEARPVFTAWKGITFYQLQVRVVGPKLKDMMTWLKSKDAIPIDFATNKKFMPQLQMFNTKIVGLINQNINDMRSVLQKYESSFDTFVGGNPAELTGFLRSARRVYYILGYCISSLNSAIAIFSHDIRPPEKTRLSFDDVNKLYVRLDTTLSRKRELPATF